MTDIATKHPKNILIFATKSEDPETGYGSGLLLAEMLTGDIDTRKALVSTIFYEDLVFIFDGSNTRFFDSVSGVDLRDFDFVFLRAWFRPFGEVAQSVAHYLEEHGVTFYNSEALYARSQTKLSQYTRLWRQGLPLPTTCYGSHDNLMAAQSGPKPLLTYPLILKSISGARGKDNYLVRSQDELTEYLESNQDLRFFMQEYIPNESDFRIVMISDKVVAVIERTRKDNTTHLNNVSQGASSKLHSPDSLDKGIVQECIRAGKAFHREISGVDIVYNIETGAHYFLEHNNMPQIETSGSSGHMVRQLAQLIKSELGL